MHSSMSNLRHVLLQPRLEFVRPLKGGVMHRMRPLVSASAFSSLLVLNVSNTTLLDVVNVNAEL